MKKIAIVGGAGFIGSNTAKHLVKLGHDVTIIDIKCKPIKNTEYIFGDARDYTSIMYALGTKKFDHVFMLTAISDSEENTRNPLCAIDTNIMALTNVLEAMSNLKLPHIVFSSTVWVYSTSTDINVDETTDLNINRSEHIYTTSKITCESIIKNYCAIRDIKYTIFRYGIAYGPECHPESVINKFLHRALTDKPLTIIGSGQAYRNFLHVEDHAAGNAAALKPVAENQTFNLEGPEQISIRGVADRIKYLLANIKDVPITYTDDRHGDYTGKIVSNKKSKDVLGWEPTITFEEGTSKMCDYMINKYI